MMPATFVTIATFLMELCSSSPVYNMQPAFITNTVGVTSGRNIRHLPCISRKSNQKGVCMFAIDCLKANGTHLGTCIDRFYFGSCCHIEPPKDIIDNAIADKREPPLRLSSTTQKTTEGTKATVSTNVTSSTSTTTSTTTTERSTSTKRPTTPSVRTTTSSSTRLTTPSIKATTPSVKTTTASIKATTTNIKATTASVRTTTQSTRVTTSVASTTKAPTQTTIKTTPSTQSTTITSTEKPKLTTPLAFGDRIPTTSTTEAATTPTRLQTFQVVDGVTIPETTTRGYSSSSTKAPKPPLTTTRYPSSSNVPSKITTTEKAENTTAKPTSRPKPTATITAVSKPQKPTKSTPKPTKSTPKPIRTTTTTKKPQEITTKSPTIVKITKKPTPASTKPTKRSTTTSRPSTTKPSIRPVTTSVRPISNDTVTQIPIKLTTKQPAIPPSTKKPIIISSTEKITTTSPQPVLTTTISNELSVDKLNVSQLLETVSGNPATNEIEALRPPAPIKPTSKPVAIWAVIDEKNHTVSTTSSSGVLLNSTTEEDWIPVTSPDHWVLLPSVAPVNISTQEVPSTSSPPPLSSSTSGQPSFEASSTASPAVSVSSSPSTTSEPPKLSTTQAPPAKENVTQSSTASIEVDVQTSSSVPASSTSVPSTSSPSSPVLSTTEFVTKPINMSDFTDVCGRRMHPTARIVGGEDAAFGEWPWQISLRQWRTSTYLHKCGAALLNENWAITAAHCVDNVPPSDLLLRLGEHDLSTQSEPYLHEERRVQIVASHPQFDPRTFEYDLALLRFYEPVNFQPNILPVCVPQTDEDFIGRTAYVTGWGRLYEDGPLPSILQKVSVPVINNTVCEQMYRSAGYIEHIPHIFICAGWRRGGFDSCEGDSGGPMVIQREDRRFLLAGVISWGIGCAEPNQPGVYTRISEFRDWINQILQF
ncbi:unnamed protein product [Callosobruchus maculatus]|uniref:Peptidase S1 domain-containing protein n=1 Tax=Callosobruchus maculatus TaxID=64391 RepID=A0A653DRL0_CALMS|nr:unnamed protein product [Callosobruchus maculatus]